MARRGGRQVAGSGTLSMNQGWVDCGANAGSTRSIVSRDGKNVYAVLAGSGVNKIAQFARDQNTGNLTALSPTTVATYLSPSVISESPDGKTIFISNAGGDSVRAYSRDASTGALTQISGINSGTYPMGNVVSPDNKDFYVVCRNPGSTKTPYVQRFARNTTDGSLAASPSESLNLSVGVEGMSMVMTSNASSGISGKYAYVGHFAGNTISCLTRNAATGVLAVNSTQAEVDAGSGQPAWLALSPDDQHLYAACDAGSSVVAFSVNQVDGSLTKLATYPGGNGPWGIAVSPNGKHLYVAESDGQYLRQFTRDPATGLLTPKNPINVRSDPYFTSTVGSGGPNGVCVSPDSRHVYSNGWLGNNALVTFNVNNP